MAVVNLCFHSVWQEAASKHPKGIEIVIPLSLAT